MRLTKKEKELLFKVTDHLTDRVGYYEVNDGERDTMYSIFRKLRMELRGF